MTSIAKISNSLNIFRIITSNNTINIITNRILLIKMSTCISNEIIFLSRKNDVDVNHINDDFDDFMLKNDYDDENIDFNEQDFDDEINDENLYDFVDNQNREKFDFQSNLIFNRI